MLSSFLTLSLLLTPVLSRPLNPRAATTVTVDAYTYAQPIPSGGANPTGTLSSQLPTATGNITGTPGLSRAAFGIQPNGTRINDIYVGFLPDWGRQTPQEMNEILGAPMPLIGDYVQVSLQDASFGALDWHSEAVRAAAANNQSVYVPAILPNFKLSNWTNAMSQALAAKAATLNKQGVTVWLRFAYEMNGAWMNYGHDPENYVKAFRSVANAVRANPDAGRTYLLWAPNVSSGDPEDPINGYTAYYPGAEYVDVAGLSLYFFGDSTQTQNAIPSSPLFINLFKSFHTLYGSSHPLIISETSAPYHYVLPSGLRGLRADAEVDPPNIKSLSRVGGTSEVDVKQAWLNQMTGEETARVFPNLTGVMLFNYVKTSDKGQLLDFRYIRSLGGNAAVEQMTRTALADGRILAPVPSIPDVPDAPIANPDVTTVRVTAKPTPASELPSATSIPTTRRASSSSSTARSASASSKASSAKTATATATATATSTATKGGKGKGADDEDDEDGEKPKTATSSKKAAKEAGATPTKEAKIAEVTAKVVSGSASVNSTIVSTSSVA